MIGRFLGLLDPLEPRKGLLFGEATNGNVTQYLKAHGDAIDLRSRIKWCKQAAEGISHCHARGVLHCDLRPDNMLLNGNLDLSLCDFGGSENAEHKGEGLPDYGFFDPRDENIEVSEATEVFGLGSSMYVFMTGHLPHGSTTMTTAAYAYVENFGRLLRMDELPDTAALMGGDIITRCWTREIKSAREVYACYSELEKQMGLDGIEVP